MSLLLDTNILTRSAQPAHSMHQVALHAVTTLKTREWERLVTQHAVSGKFTYDARIVAAMNIHGITHLLTFNSDDFKRYPGITAVSPSDIG